VLPLILLLSFRFWIFRFVSFIIIIILMFMFKTGLVVPLGQHTLLASAWSDVTLEHLALPTLLLCRGWVVWGSE
jgi:hypothetical protein